MQSPFVVHVVLPSPNSPQLPREWIIASPPLPQLFNVDQDPLEENDLALHFPGRLAKMNISLENWFEEVERERQRLL